MDKSSYSEILGQFGVPKSTLTYFLKIIFSSLKCSSLKHLWDLMGFGKTTKRIVREVIDKIVVNTKRVNKTYPLKDEESYMMEKIEIDGAQGLPRDIHTFTDELQQVLHAIGGKIVGNCIKPPSSQMYARRLNQRVNINEEGAEGQKQRNRTGMIKVLNISHKRAKQSDPGITWFMLHTIYCIYNDNKNKEERNAAMLLTSMPEHEE